jgi:chromosome segregation ATPase
VNIDVQGGLLALLGTILVGLLGWRGINKVKTDNARENRESRFEANLQDRYDAALGRISELNAALQQARDGRALLEKQARQQAKSIQGLLDMLSERERKQVERWVRETGFAPFDDEPPKGR